MRFSTLGIFDPVKVKPTNIRKHDIPRVVRGRQYDIGTLNSPLWNGKVRKKHCKEIRYVSTGICTCWQHIKTFNVLLWYQTLLLYERL